MVAAALVAAVLFGVAFAVDRALGENGVSRTDRQLASALRASTAALDARVARAGAEAERLTGSATRWPHASFPGTWSRTGCGSASAISASA